MIIDCLIVLVVIAFTVLDWCLGLVRTWSVPISIVVATLVSQHLYIDLSTLIVEILHVEPPFAVFTAYLLVWFGLAQYCDALLSHVFKSSSDKEPPLLLEIGGAILGFAKGSVAFVLAAMVAYAQNKIPEPPKVSYENKWIISMVADSSVLPRLHRLARQLDEPLGKYVLSDAAPRFKPDFALGNDPLAPIIEKEERRGYKIGQGYRRVEQLLQQVESKY